VDESVDKVIHNWVTGCGRLNDMRLACLYLMYDIDKYGNFNVIHGKIVAS
jgi:hypothetical protein